MRIEWCGKQHHWVIKADFHLATFIDDIVISTVGEGYDSVSKDWFHMGYFPNGNPVYYETMVFDTDGDWEDGHPSISDYSEKDKWVAATYQVANEHHMRMVKKLTRGMK